MGEQPAVVAFNNTQPEDTSLHHILAYEPDVGATFGVAHDLERDQVYVGAYTKRLARYGPLGPGGIYRIDLRTGEIEPWAILEAGDDPHQMRATFADLAAASYVGRVGLGDIEMSEGNDQLYAVNLADKLIYRFSVPDGRLIDAFPHGAAGQWWAADAAPFGLAFRDGWLYHGVVDTLMTPFEAGESADQRRAQRGFVYRSRPDGSDMREVVQVDLDYGRSPPWEPWALQLPDNTTRREPMLVDIEFRTDGDLILGVRDRGGDARILRAGHGDMVLTMGIEDGDRYIPLTIPEVYKDNLRHTESSWGSLAALPWLDETVSTVIDPIRIWSGGAAWFDNVGGGDTRREEVYSGRNQTFGKSAGLGDIEALCEHITVTPSPTPTDTETPVDTPTSLVTLTPSITPTPTPGYYEIYLPAGEKGAKCIPDAFHSDVVLVLDRSTSMLRPVEDGGIPKNQAAIDAAKQFVSLLDFTPDTLNRHDQVAIVGFNDTAWVQQYLGSSHEAAYGSLDQLSTMTQEGTRLDLAFLRGQEPLDGPNRKPENRPVMVLLTDGLPNRVPTPAPVGPQEQTVVEAAQLAKNKGTRIYTIGLGKPTDINPRMLIMAASERWMYYYAPRPEDLSGIYSQIAQTFDDCEPVNIDRPTPCIPEEIFTDVVLVLDMSTSMYRETRTGRTKHGLAVEAAALFAEQLQLEPDGWGRQDQVAVVGFNDTAWTEVPLTADLEAVHKGLGELLAKIEEGTRLDLAFDEGQRAVEGAGHYPENQMVMVFLTDGLPNRVPTPVPEGPQEQTVLEAATRARLLEMAASTPDDYYFAPDGEDLSDIYRQIAGRIVECP
jgi:Mg-chelatase subunit ChlD